jgi:hypothetical protein
MQNADPNEHFTLCFGDIPFMKAIKSTFLSLTSNVPVQLVIANQCPLMKSFQFGEAPFFMKVSKLGHHEKVLEGLWGHAQLFR